MRACIPSQEPSQAASHPAGPMCQGPVEVLGAACHVLNIIKPSMEERKFDIIWPIPICYDCYDHADFDFAMVMESCLPPCYVNASVMQCIHVVSHARFLCTARPRNASCQRCHYTSPAESIQRKTELLALKWAKRYYLCRGKIRLFRNGSAMFWRISWRRSVDLGTQGHI
jgi:hypothetical protein